MEGRRVFSGYTQTIEDKMAKWYEDLAGEKMEWEELAAAESTNDLLRKLKTAPLYQYLMNYLLYIWEGREEKVIVCEETVEELIAHVTKTFRSSGMPEEKCTYAHIREMLTTEWSRSWDSFDRAASGRIFELGLGLGLPVEDVEELLQKAVKRAGFNYYNSEELLVYCALRFCEKNHYRCFQALMRDYENIGPAEPIRERARFNSTEEVRDQMIEALENSVSGSGVYRSEECAPGTLNPELEKFFARHKAAVPQTRTAAVVFMELFRQFTEVHEQEILDFKRTDRSTEEYAEVVLKIEYDAQQEICLPEGTVFYAVKGREKRREQFVLENETLLPQRETVEVRIPVQGTEAYAISLAKKMTPGYVGKGEDIFPDQTAVRAGVISAYTATTLKYTGQAGELRYAAGEICAVCRPGTEIPVGTKFFAGNYTYETRKSVTANASGEITVRSMTPSKEGAVIAETGEIRYTDNSLEGILAVYNEKPAKRKKTTKKITKELFRDFLYVKNAQRLDTSERQIDGTLIGPWFTETEIKSKRFSDIQRQADGTKEQEKDRMENTEVRRCDIITMAFLNFCMDSDYQPYEECVMENDTEAVYKDFLVYVNGYLRKCGMMPFYLQNPYECILAYLMQTDTPVDSLRNMWKIVNAGKEGADD